MQCPAQQLQLLVVEKWQTVSWVTHTHTHTFNGPLSGTTRVSRYQKGKTIWILLKQETVSGSGISWAICKSAPRSRQIPCQHPTAQFFTGRMPFLPPNQQRQSTEGKCVMSKLELNDKPVKESRVTPSEHACLQRDGQPENMGPIYKISYDNLTIISP